MRSNQGADTLVVYLAYVHLLIQRMFFALETEILQGLVLVLSPWGSQVSASHFPPGSVMGLHFRLGGVVCVTGTMDLQFCSVSPRMHKCCTLHGRDFIIFKKASWFINCKCLFVVKLLSSIQLFCSPMDCSLPDLSMRSPRQEYCSGFPFPSPGVLPNPGIKPRSNAFQADPLPSEPPGECDRKRTLNKKILVMF